MEFLDGQTATEYYRGLDRSRKDAVHEDVKRAIEILHDRNLVFGDLRKPNIIIYPFLRKTRLARASLHSFSVKFAPFDNNMAAESSSLETVTRK
jgi:tRNA A-37 threonylcarbamoyl transferase component Bud32